MTDISVVIEEPDDSVRFNEDADSIEADQPDGGVVVQLNAGLKKPKDESFYRNLADDIDQSDLYRITEELFTAITADDESRQQSLAIRARGIDLLGLKLEEPKSSVGESTAGVDGISSVTNPLLLESCLKSWANARSELLPADGPVKIQVDGTETDEESLMGETLERAVNHYLTQVATEYYPETSHMLLWGTIFGGSGFKKLYRCPMRRRPVSETVDVEDLIVSDATKDFRSCARITNQVKMRPSVMKRMMHLDVYRDIPLTQPSPEYNTIDNKIDNIQGVQSDKKRPEDQPYTIWETQCELDLDEFAPTEFKGTGIPLPYRVTMDKDSRKVLAVIRDWREDDKECKRRRMYVKYPYIPGPGFYGTGMLGMLGNCSAALTAIWREAIDAGMFASFPGGLIAKLATHQDTMDFRLAPGEFKQVNTNNMPINQAVMPLPYRDASAGLMSMMDKIEAQAKAVGGAVEIPASEGIANIPVGTMLAQIEQATKVIAAVHKDMHQAQADEFEILMDLFREHPEDFFRDNRIALESIGTEEVLLQSLEDYTLVPRADPNTPSHIHRVSQVLGLVNLYQVPGFGPYFDVKQLLMRCMRVLREDPVGLLIDPPPQTGGDPAMMIKAQADMTKANAAMQKNQIEAYKVTTQSQTDKDRAAIDAAQMAAEQQLANTKMQTEQIIHRNDAFKSMLDIHSQRMKTQADVQQRQAEAAGVAHDQALARGGHVLDVMKTHHDMQMDRADLAMRQAEMHHERQMAQQEAENTQRQQEMDMVQADREHQMKQAELSSQDAQADRDHELAKKQATKPKNE